MTRTELVDELLTLRNTLDGISVRRPGAYAELGFDAFMAMVDREGELLHLLYEVSPVS